MADRFPSIEDIDEGKAPQAGDGEIDLMDGGDSSDFLSRERAALGADADQFSTPNDAGANGDMMGSEEVSQFQSSFPPVSTANDRVAPGGSVTGAGNRATSPYPPTASFADEEEPDVIKQWRERRNLAIQAREEAATARKAETVKAAQEAVDDFYENYNNKKDKGIAQTKKEAEEFLASREDTSAGGTSWERIGKLVEVSRGGKAAGGAAEGKEKFRDMLVGLMKDKDAPGAKGY